MVRARRSISPVPGCIARVMPYCTSMTSAKPTSSSLNSGVIDHAAFGCRGFQAMKQHLTGKGVPHHVNQVPNSTRWQIFLRDPNNVEIELNFETKKSWPSFTEAESWRQNPIARPAVLLISRDH